MSTRWLIDGTNVVGSRPDGWWRDRHAAFRRLVDELATLAEQGDEVTVVFDGRPAPRLEEGDVDGVCVRWARRPGRDAADDRIVELVEDDDAPSELTVVTSDQALADRVEQAGATVQGSGGFRRRLDDRAEG